MSDVTREEIELLRLSADVLIRDVADPCWGFAQRLSELAERLVRESGMSAACYGNNRVLSEFDVVAMIGMGQGEPVCCPACGCWDGAHSCWCIHAHGGELPAEQPEPVASKYVMHYFGCCPKCHLPGVLTFIGTDDWMVCERHLIAWWIGSGLFSGWQELTFEQHEANKALIERCERIEPPHCTCSGSPFEGDIPEWPKQAVPDDSRAIVDDLLAWLDLSGLPPVPPVPPARRRPGEPGDQIPFE